MAAPIFYTADMVRALPDDGNRYEVVYGELLVTPSPRAWHQELVARIFVALRTYTAESGKGHVLFSPADISPRPDVLVQPDIFVVPRAEALTWDWTQFHTLLLVIEVLSPSTAHHDRFTKRRFYQEAGVSVYWTVDPKQKTVEVWTPDTQFPTIESETVSWHPSGTSEAFVLDLGELFRKD